MKKKVTIVFDHWEELDAWAREKGFHNVASLARVAVTEYRAVHASEDAPLHGSTVELRLKNADEIQAYAEEKGLRNIPTLAEFCINRYMTQYPSKNESGVPPARSTARKTKVHDNKEVSNERTVQI